MLNEYQIKHKWQDIKGGIRNMWGKISDEELDAINGDVGKLEEMVEEKYGDSREHIKEDLQKVFSSYDNESDLADYDTNRSSFMRTPEGDENKPNGIRTSGKSQFQDKVQERKTQSPERTVFEKQSKDKLEQ